MPTEVVEFLNSFQLGSSIKFMIAMGTFIGGCYAFYRKIVKRIEQRGSKEILSEMEKTDNEKKLEGLRNDIDKLQKDITEINNELESFKNDMAVKVKNIISSVNDSNTNADSLHSVSVKNVEYISEQIKQFEKDIFDIETKLESITDNINILMDSDVSTHKAFIISEYQRCVKEAKEIDLISLQNVESIYKKYLAEDKNGGDEFITSLVREIRNLPTHK